MMTPQRHTSTLKEATMRILNVKTDHIGPNAVRVDRSGPWGNPFVIGRDGTRDQVIALYRQWLWRMILRDVVTKERLRELQGRDLACHCAPQRCHAEVIRSAVRWACK
jgi:hypothetical protein